MTLLTAFGMALALFLAVVPKPPEGDGNIRLADDRQASGRDHWDQAPIGHDIRLARNSYAYAPASCAFNPRLAGQVQRVSALWAAITSVDRLGPVSEIGRSWCGQECASRDIVWQESAGDPDKEGCWVWVEYYLRSLFVQRPWPFCTCKFEWSLLERTCEVDSNALAEAMSEGLGVAEVFPDEALHEFIWAAGW